MHRRTVCFVGKVAFITNFTRNKFIQSELFGSNLTDAVVFRFINRWSVNLASAVKDFIPRRLFTLI